MKNDWLHRPRATVKILPGKETWIGKTKQGRVGLISKRYKGEAVANGEIWLVDVVHETPGYFIMIPIERIRDAA